jgi:hypothetical protein
VERFAEGSGKTRTLTSCKFADGGVWWTGSGEHLVAASGRGLAEFAVIEVSEEGRRIEVVRWLTACPYGPNLPEDIFTFNGLLTPPVTPTLPPTATATPTPTDVPSSPSPMPSQSPAPSPTGTPAPIYLPILLRESCTPAQQRTDVDVGDQAAIVSFNADATLRAELTADRASLDAALASITPASQTCLVCGVDAGADELASSRRRADNTPLLIVLTDGLSNPRPASEAVERAAEAKAAGVVIHTIGLGDTLDFEALEAMATEPDDFHRAPDGEDLAAIYAQIAVEIPCPPSRLWGRR